jgi:putative transposase
MSLAQLLQFRRLIAESRATVIRLPPRSPNFNAYAERLVLSIEEKCLDRMIFVGQASLRRAITQFMGHYHCEGNHQDIGNRLIQPRPTSLAPGDSIRRRQPWVGC